jgi:hypothetical protein
MLLEPALLSAATRTHSPHIRRRARPFACPPARGAQVEEVFVAETNRVQSCLNISSEAPLMRVLEGALLLEQTEKVRRIAERRGERGGGGGGWTAGSLPCG